MATCALLVAGISFYSGCAGQAPAKPGTLQTDPRFANAVRLYRANCVACHGDRLQGGVGPNLEHVGARLTEAAIARQIDKGGGPMPGYGPDQQGILTRAEIDELAAWLSTLR